MTEAICFVLALSVLLGAVLAIILAIKNGSFNLHIKAGKKDDALLIHTEHHQHDSLDE